MAIIGLTGGIASGKSTASRLLREMGAAVIDADAISRELTCEGGAALPRLRECFGSSYFDGQGRLDRKKLAALVFGDPATRRRLEAILHPMVFEEMRRQMRGRANAILDVPLLFESGADALCDQIWVVASPAAVRIRRVMERDGLSPEEARARIASQMPDEERERRADLILRNDGDPESFLKKVRAAYERLYTT